MAYTFGGATSDDITFTTNVTIGANSRAVFICGWWYPTTLTTSRTLWSINSTGACSLRVGNTTSELMVRTDNTTDGEWETTGANIVVNKWHFIAVLGTFNNTGPTNAWRIWVGDLENAPTMFTPGVTSAPTGNNTGSAAFYIGNAGTGLIPFQGDIGWVFVYTTSAAVGALHPFRIITFGVISTDQERWVYEKYVLPMWEGKGIRGYSGLLQRNGVSNASTDDMLLINLDKTLPIVQRYTTVNATTFMYLAATINGATPSGNRSPRPALDFSPVYPMVQRR